MANRCSRRLPYEVRAQRGVAMYAALGKDVWFMIGQLGAIFVGFSPWSKTMDRASARHPISAFFAR
jgi:hypothetical protein